jgi:hypothetical protein
LAIDYDSQLPEVPDLRRFTRLEYLHLAGRKLAAQGSSISEMHSAPTGGALAQTSKRID